MGNSSKDRVSTAMFEILLSLAGEDLHGYAIMKEVEARTVGEVKLGPTSLYRSLNKLLQLGYIEEVDGDEVGADPDRRRVYRLLDPGREVAARRAYSLSRSVETARERRLFSGEGAS